MNSLGFDPTISSMKLEFVSGSILVFFLAPAYFMVGLAGFTELSVNHGALERNLWV